MTSLVDLLVGFGFSFGVSVVVADMVEAVTPGVSGSVLDIAAPCFKSSAL